MSLSGIFSYASPRHSKARFLTILSRLVFLLSVLIRVPACAAMPIRKSAEPPVASQAPANGLIVEKVRNKWPGEFAGLKPGDILLNWSRDVPGANKPEKTIKEIRGEGVGGLTRAFMHAGARRVIVSMWSVNAPATAELMQRFYQEMLGTKKLRPAAALQAAQTWMWRKKRWQSPYYWAAFVLQGDWR